MTLEVRPIKDPSVFAAMAAIKIKAFRDSILNNALYCHVSDEDMVAWLIEREKVEARTNKTQRVAGVFEVLPDDRRQEDAAILLAWIKWSVFATENANVVANEADHETTNEASQYNHENDAEETTCKDANFGLPPLPEGTNLALNDYMRRSLKEKYMAIDHDAC